MRFGDGRDGETDGMEGCCLYACVHTCACARWVGSGVRRAWSLDRVVCVVRQLGGFWTPNLWIKIGR